MNKKKTINTVKKLLQNFSIQEIEEGIYSFSQNEENEIANFIKKEGIQNNIETIIDLFECLVDKHTKSKNGVVFTPKYISDYIVINSIGYIKELNTNTKILDPACGCGIFIYSAIEFLKNRFNTSVEEIVKNNIYGCDIDQNNVKRCKHIIKLIGKKYNESLNEDSINIFCIDSLKSNLKETLSADGFDFIIGNPPYANPHDLNQNVRIFLSSSFNTTKFGTFNIFYAFIEKLFSELKTNGILSYIIPNNFLVISSAKELRKFLREKKCIKSILNFSDNLIFYPTRTYSCIITLKNKKTGSFKYAAIKKEKDICNAIKNANYIDIKTEILNDNGWILNDHIVSENIKKIERNAIQLGKLVRTGIATLRDNIYLINRDKYGYYGTFESEKFYIEPEIVKPLYKVSEIKDASNINLALRYIIFPYTKNNKKYSIINEEDLSIKYPKAYKYLLRWKEELCKRDGGKPNKNGWYAYGRTQGLNEYGKKLLSPTFSNAPKFIASKNPDALFCNGYGIFENQTIELDILQKVTNSIIMDYYIKNTSYAIEGKYYCYQKKYIDKFTIPNFSNEEKALLRESTNEEINKFLIKKYDINF